MKSEEIKLEQYFDENGSTGWDNMVNWSSQEYWVDSISQRKLKTELQENDDIAKVMYAKLGEESLDWIHKKVPALDNITPFECLETPELIKRLKECLMRMP